MSGPSAWESLSAALGQVPTGGSPLEALTPMLAGLVEATGATAAEVWAAGGSSLVRIARWPGVPTGPATGPPDPGVLPDTEALAGRPGVSAVMPVMDGDVERGAITLHGPPAGAADRARLRDTAACTALLLRGPQLATALGRRLARARQRTGEVVASRQRLAAAEELERRRTAAEITAVSAGRLAEIRRRLVELTAAVVSGTGNPAATLHTLRGALEDLVDDFRVVVRGVHPTVLRSHGARSALAELAADLPAPVRIGGSFGQRPSWEVESSLYWVAAATLRTTAVAGAPEIRVTLADVAGRLEIRVEQPAAVTGALHSTVNAASERLSAFGGGVEIHAAPNQFQVRAWVPPGLMPVLPAMSPTEPILPPRD